MDFKIDTNVPIINDNPNESPRHTYKIRLDQLQKISDEQQIKIEELKTYIEKIEESFVF